MKLSKVKKVCTDAQQLRVVATLGEGNNLVSQWVGTQDALYPVEGLTVSEEMLQVLWELSPAQINAIEEHPVHHAPEFLRSLPGLVEKDSVKPICIAQVMGYQAMKCGEQGVVFVDPDKLRPCGDWRQFVIHYDNAGPWVVVYDDGKLNAVVRPVDNEKAMQLLAIAKVVAGRKVEARVE